VDTNSTSRTDAADAGKGCDRLRRQKAKRSTTGRENLLADAERRPALGSRPEHNCQQFTRAKRVGPVAP